MPERGPVVFRVEPEACHETMGLSQIWATFRLYSGLKNIWRAFDAHNTLLLMVDLRTVTTPQD